jgi:hypothetical protein
MQALERSPGWHSVILPSLKREEEAILQTLSAIGPGSSSEPGHAIADHAIREARIRDLQQTLWAIARFREIPARHIEAAKETLTFFAAQEMAQSEEEKEERVRDHRRAIHESAAAH